MDTDLLGISRTNESPTIAEYIRYNSNEEEKLSEFYFKENLPYKESSLAIGI